MYIRQKEMKSRRELECDAAAGDVRVEDLLSWSWLIPTGILRCSGSGWHQRTVDCLEKQTRRRKSSGGTAVESQCSCTSEAFLHSLILYIKGAAAHWDRLLHFSLRGWLMPSLHTHTGPTALQYSIYIQYIYTLACTHTVAFIRVAQFLKSFTPAA